VSFADISDVQCASIVMLYMILELDHIETGKKRLACSWTSKITNAQAVRLFMACGDSIEGRTKIITQSKRIVVENSLLTIALGFARCMQEVLTTPDFAFPKHGSRSTCFQFLRTSSGKLSRQTLGPYLSYGASYSLLDGFGKLWLLVHR
jgi:hypothetical protein